MTATIHHGDALEVLRSLPSNSFHGSLSDPPYGLAFMGHAWDRGVPSTEVWAEVLRCLKPGAHLLAFGGTRTFHRLTCAIEDAGFEIRDCMSWLYGSGFPKSMNVSIAIDKSSGAMSSRGKAFVTAGEYGGRNLDGPNRDIGDHTPITESAKVFDGYGTALKPAWEPIIVARKPLVGTVAANVQEHGCGGLAIDACRIGYASEDDKAAAAAAAQRACQDQNRGLRTHGNFAVGAGADTVAPFIEKQELGRWPANVILDEEAGAMLNKQSGNRKSTLAGRADPSAPHAHPADPSGSRASMFGNGQARGNVYADSGGASRFFYCAKASKNERNAGDVANIHPTVKPIALARYLARLILPPTANTRLLNPFSGSGSEAIGALLAGWSHVDGIDSWDEAVRISRARIAHWAKEAA